MITEVKAKSSLTPNFVSSLVLSFSSAMNVVGAVRTAMDLPEGSKVVTFICDSGQRHVTRFWNRDFVLQWGLVWPGDVPIAERLPSCLCEVMDHGRTEYTNC